MNLIAGQEAFSKFMAEANHIAATDYGSFADFLNRHKYVPTTLPPEDPNSDAFMAWQLQLWREISGRMSYTPEVDELDSNVLVEAEVGRQFPFSTNDPVTIGNYLSAIGLIVKALNLHVGDKVIEFGVGWGHTTLNLARCGYKVIAMDIEAKFLEMIQRRAAKEDLRIETIQGEFLELPSEAATFDAALFFECFHHCINFRELIQRLRKVLKPGGKVVFCGETFYGEWFDFPWGVRLDGHSIWAIRNFGWMELGFRESYISRILQDAGFDVEKSQNPIGVMGSIFTATQRQ